MAHFAFVNKSQNQYNYKWNLNLIDKCKMCHFECHGLKLISDNFLVVRFSVGFLLQMKQALPNS
jgi:hypothetical protein